MSETKKNPADVISLVQAALDNFPLLENFSDSDIVLTIKRELNGQIWKQYSLQIEDASSDAKALAGDWSFGDDEIDSQVIGLFMSKGLEQTVSKILQHYHIHPTPDQWQTLRVWSRGDLEAQRQLNWLLQSYRLLERQMHNLESVVNRQELSLVKRQLSLLNSYLLEYESQLGKNPNVTISRTVDKAFSSITEIKKSLQDICSNEI